MGHIVRYSVSGRKPIIKLGIAGPAMRFIQRRKVLVATNSELTLLHSDMGRLLGVARTKRPPDRVQIDSLNFKGAHYRISFGRVTLQLLDRDGVRIRWPATVGFWDAPADTDYLGLAEGLEYLDPTIRPNDQIVEFAPNGIFPGEVLGGQ